MNKKIIKRILENKDCEGVVHTTIVERGDGDLKQRIINYFDKEVIK